ncbi:MAG: hypothetical protein AAF226_12295, partial [Verrucomicrobiota bacterium]
MNLFTASARMLILLLSLGMLGCMGRVDDSLRADSIAHFGPAKVKGQPVKEYIFRRSGVILGGKNLYG